MSPATIPEVSNSVRCCAKMFPVTAPPTITSRAVTSPTTDAPCPITTRSARLIEPSRRPSIRSAPSVSRSPVTAMCESRTEKFVVGMGDDSRRLNKLMTPRGRDYDGLQQGVSQQLLNTRRCARTNIEFRLNTATLVLSEINKCLQPGLVTGLTLA